MMFKSLETNKQYLKFVYKRRDSKYISATLKEVRPIVEIMPSELNKNPYLLNTPSGTFDLRKGLGGFSEHKAEDFITKITTVSPAIKVRIYGLIAWIRFMAMPSLLIMFKEYVDLQ